uniref:Uncharacterized protein n=1 Tax=Arundo donax TaxID=35708 RepID=A0A0A9CN77_ARUDO
MPSDWPTRPMQTSGMPLLHGRRRRRPPRPRCSVRSSWSRRASSRCRGRRKSCRGSWRAWGASRSRMRLRCDPRWNSSRRRGTSWLMRSTPRIWHSTRPTMQPGSAK